MPSPVLFPADFKLRIKRARRRRDDFAVAGKRPHLLAFFYEDFVGERLDEFAVFLRIKFLESDWEENASANGGSARCVYCGEKVSNEPGPNQTNIDHVQPRANSGNSSLNNAQVTCRYCNQSKGTGPAPREHSEQTA